MRGYTFFKSYIRKFNKHSVCVFFPYDFSSWVFRKSMSFCSLMCGEWLLFLKGLVKNLTSLWSITPIGYFYLLVNGKTIQKVKWCFYRIKKERAHSADHEVSITRIFICRCHFAMTTVYIELNHSNWMECRIYRIFLTAWHSTTDFTFQRSFKKTKTEKKRFQKWISSTGSEHSKSLKPVNSLWFTEWGWTMFPLKIKYYLLRVLIIMYTPILLCTTFVSFFTNKFATKINTIMHMYLCIHTHHQANRETASKNATKWNKMNFKHTF